MGNFFLSIFFPLFFWQFCKICMYTYMIDRLVWIDTMVMYMCRWTASGNKVYRLAYKSRRSFFVKNFMQFKKNTKMKDTFANVTYHWITRISFYIFILHFHDTYLIYHCNVKYYPVYIINMAYIFFSLFAIKKNSKTADKNREN